MAATHRVITDEELLRLPRDGRKYELVDGEIRVSPAGSRHGEVSAALLALLFTFVKPRKLGKVFDSSTGFRLPTGNLRAPDIGFVASSRIPGGRSPVGFFEGSPDLAVEVLSPEDRLRAVLEKVGEWLDAGTLLVWVIDPEKRRASVYRTATAVREIHEDGQLDGEDVLPGFNCPLTDILD